MTKQSEYFPPEIERLPDFDGPFDAYQLSAENCDVLFASYPAGVLHAAQVANDGAEIEFWFKP